VGFTHPPVGLTGRGRGPELIREQLDSGVSGWPSSCFPPEQAGLPHAPSTIATAHSRPSMPSLAAVLDRLDAECERSNWKHRDEEPLDSSEAPRTIHMGRIQDVLGSRSFGPILLVSGLFCVTPVGVVPGVPTMLAFLVLLVSVQQVAGKESLWLPSFMRDRELKTRRVAKSVQILRRVAGPLDRIFRARLTWLVEGGGARAVGGLTALMALLIPPLEFVPFSVTIPAVALAGIGLGILTRDGLLLLGTVALVAGAFVLLARGVLL